MRFDDVRTRLYNELRSEELAIGGVFRGQEGKLLTRLRADDCGSDLYHLFPIC
jgi:hypothetical protein